MALVLGMALQEGASYGLERELDKLTEDPYNYDPSGVASYQDTISLAGRLQQVGLVAVLIVTSVMIYNLERAVGIRD